MELDDEVVIRPGVVLPGSALRWRFSSSGGPGGQHANTSNTRVELWVRVEEIVGLSPSELTRIRMTLGDVVEVSVTDQRSQWQNRLIARERMTTKLNAALEVPKNRRPTRATLGSQRRRLQAKRERSDVKANRRRPRASDE